MSDFIFSKKKVSKGELSTAITSIYKDIQPPEIKEYHGGWGSLAVSKNLYNSFDVLETAEHIFVVIGGPVLEFQDKKVIGNNENSTGTFSIYKRWLSNDLKWDEDLSGPFVIFIVNKSSSILVCVTDLMSFIPVYTYQDKDNLVISTHIDALAKVTNQHHNFDIVSQVDFILNGVVTYPFTPYINIKQIAPASKHVFSRETESNPYWIPKEEFIYESVGQAAEALRHGLQKYIDKVANFDENVAQFISGGEDSRLVSALLANKKREAYIFLDSMNREGEIAKKAALAYNAKFVLELRSKMHYLNIMPNSAKLVGNGSQYFHAHTYGFHEKCNLSQYSAVFGGLLSDGLIKGSHIKKHRILKRLPFFPQIINKTYSAADPIYSNLIKPEILQELTDRRNTHLKYVKGIREKSAEEWFELWPISMNPDIANLHANRRLFRSYEPFMSKDVVKISAVIPQKWKLNRRLFHKVAKPLFAPTKWLLHGEGRLPYFPWQINIFVNAFTWGYYQFVRRSGLVKRNQGPWNEWDVVLNSIEWKTAIHQYSNGFYPLKRAFMEKDVNKLFNENHLTTGQQINLLQVLHMNNDSD